MTITRVYGPDGYDEDGYDQDGYDREGFDRLGFDRNMRDRRGHLPIAHTETTVEETETPLGRREGA